MWIVVRNMLCFVGGAEGRSVGEGGGGALSSPRPCHLDPVAGYADVSDREGGELWGTVWSPHYVFLGEVWMRYG